MIYFVFMCCAFWEQNIILLRFVCKNINCFCCSKVVIRTYIYSLIFRRVRVFYALTFCVMDDSVDCICDYYLVNFETKVGFGL